MDIMGKEMENPSGDIKNHKKETRRLLKLVRLLLDEINNRLNNERRDL